MVKPISGGGIPPGIPRLKLEFKFNDGGHDLFREKFETMKERHAYAAQMMQETGQVIPTGEDLPVYTASAAATSSAPSQFTTDHDIPSSHAAPSQAQPTPDEPPPDYEEAQFQAVGMQMEEREREEAERR